MKEKLEEAMKTLRVDYMDVRIEDRKETRIQYNGKNLEQIGEMHGFGGCIRVKDKGRWGVVSFTAMDDLNKSIFLAAREAKVGKSGVTELAAVPHVEDKVKKRLPSKDDPREISLSEKEKLVHHYNDLILSAPRISTSTVFYKDVGIKKHFINSEGTYIEEERVECGMSVQAIAREGANVQRAYDSIGGITGFAVVRDMDERIKELTESAASLLDAKPAKGGKFDCIIDPRLAGTFIHEAFGHMSESDHISENEKIRDLMEMGKPLGASDLTVIDDGTLADCSGTNKYDDEGVAARKNHLIKEGKIVGRLHSRETAGKMKENVSGNARALDFRYDPIVRMTNTYIEPRSWKFDEMVKQIEKGYYVKGSQGGMTNLDMFTFSAGEAYEIVKGKVKDKVRDLTLTGNIFETMKNIECIGNDLQMFNSGGSGGCGKGGQVPLPIGRGGPHVLIRNVIVGGR
ncbi:MAG: TldD/PmbA family protein [Candidatus Eremiobacteraeota bacterium]|nr:TldD/PmbA family protein [Candidatus Eremiobacteraeota bacterium]